MPCSGLSVRPLWPNSGVVVLPIRTAPAARSRAGVTPSADATLSAKMCEPWVVRTPATSIRSLMLTGRPCSGPSGLPSRTAASALRALSRASSAMMVTKALIFGWLRMIAPSTTSTYSSGESLPRRIRLRASTADMNNRSSLINSPL